MLTSDSKGNSFSRTLYHELDEWAYQESQKENHLIGVLLCEGDEGSIDKAVYGCVFQDLRIIPVGNCVEVRRYLPKTKSILREYGMYGFGIIDRDALSKNEVRNLLKNDGVYTTKLPFIENIICTPEVLSVVFEVLGLDYETNLNFIEEQLVKFLWQKFKEALPINLGIDKMEQITYLNIGAATKKKTIHKRVDKSSILYSYRDKIVASLVASRIGFDGKRDYYRFMADLINDERYRARLAHIFSCFIPFFELYKL